LSWHSVSRFGEKPSRFGIGPSEADSGTDPHPEIARLPGDPPSPYEERYSFSRIVTAGAFVLIGGTTAVDPCGVVLGWSPYEQTIEILRKVEHELSRAGVGLTDVIQTRVYVTDISRADEVGRAHAEVFGEIRPLMTMVEVSALIDPRMLVEIEVVAMRAGVSAG
jgi:enamine deaminase RidA (YjgF/YER057c/UK114 family)